MVLRAAVMGVAHIPHAMSYTRCLVGRDDVELVGVYDADPELRERVATRFGVEAFDDPGALLSRGLDAVVVCSETIGHRELVELAAHHGVHVLCEKPIATTLVDARAMIDACAAGRVQLHTAFVCRFYPVVQQARAAIAAGKIGSVIGMVGGNRGVPPLPPQYPSWITDPERAGGGALLDHSVHVVDTMRHITGLDVVRVNAEVDDRFWQAGVDDLAVLSLVFDGGAIASVDPSWSVTAANPWSYDFFLRVLGSEGALDLDDTRESLHVVTESGLRLVPFGVDIDAVMVDAFLDSIRAGELLDPCADGDDGYRALEIALAGYQAATAGDSVALSSGGA
jgi:predicted dehydrogenase